MKYVKALGLAVVALMVFAGSASATILTGVAGAKYLAGTTVHGVAEGALTLHPPIGDIVCEESTVGGAVSNAGGAEATVSVTLSALTFSKCNATVTVLNKGSLEIHTEFETTGFPSTSHQKSSGTGNGTLTSTGMQFTVAFAGFHCVFQTNGTDLGTVTGSRNFIEKIDNPGKINELVTLSGWATLDIKATIPRTSGSSGAFCGSTAQWTGSYEFLSPSYMDVE